MLHLRRGTDLDLVTLCGLHLGEQVRYAMPIAMATDEPMPGPTADGADLRCEACWKRWRAERPSAPQRS